MSIIRGHKRWLIVVMLFFLSTINYLDRQSLSVLAPTLREQLSFSVEQYSYIVSAFLVAYTTGYLFCGRVLDRLGTRGGISIAISLWSAAACLHALARSWTHFAGFRFLLGLGESFNAPGGAKAIREWIPQKERALCMAVFSTGNIFGAIIAPPVVSLLALKFDWRLAFLVTGLVGFIWLFFWLKIYRSPDRDLSLAPAERQLILSDQNNTDASTSTASFWAVLGHPLTLAFILARLLTDSVPFFFSFWLPDYLRQNHNFGLAQIGMFAWIPYLAADLGGITGGASSDFLVRRGWRAADARRRILLVAACLTPAALVAVHVSSAIVSLVCIGLVLAAHSAWITNLLTLMTESMPPHFTGQLVALSGVGGSIGGIISNLATGKLVATFGYVPVFTLLSFVHSMAFIILCVLSRRAHKSLNCCGQAFSS
jgi:ACS family hexuronate transporter-like MFS transporter